MKTLASFCYLVGAVVVLLAIPAFKIADRMVTNGVLDAIGPWGVRTVAALIFVVPGIVLLALGGLLARKP